MSVYMCNLLASFMGRGWGILITAAVVPFYIKLCGIEAYRLVSFYITVQAVFNYFLDFGISTTINREIAHYSVSPDTNNDTRSLGHILGIGYWLIGIFLGLVLIVKSGWIADNWTNTENIPSVMVKQTRMVMGLVVIFQCPLSFCQGALT